MGVRDVIPLILISGDRVTVLRGAPDLADDALVKEIAWNAKRATRDWGILARVIHGRLQEHTTADVEFAVHRLEQLLGDGVDDGTIWRHL